MGWDGVTKLLLLLQRARPIKHNCCSRGNLSIKHKTPDCRWMIWCRGGVNKHLDYKIIFFLLMIIVIAMQRTVCLIQRQVKKSLNLATLEKYGLFNVFKHIV